MEDVSRTTSAPAVHVPTVDYGQPLDSRDAKDRVGTSSGHSLIQGATPTPTRPEITHDGEWYGELRADAWPFAGAALLVAAALALALGDVAVVAPTLVAAVAVAAARFDQHTHRIPNRLVLLGLGVVAVGAVVVAAVGERSVGVLIGDLALGLVLGGAPLVFLAWLIAPASMGGGDWKLLTVLGMGLGFVAPLAAPIVVVVGFVVGLVVAAVTRARHIALGAPLAVGYLVAFGFSLGFPDLVGGR